MTSSRNLMSAPMRGQGWAPCMDPHINVYDSGTFLTFKYWLNETLASMANVFRSLCTLSRWIIFNPTVSSKRFFTGKWHFWVVQWVGGHICHLHNHVSAAQWGIYLALQPTNTVSIGCYFIVHCISVDAEIIFMILSWLSPDCHSLSWL